jgi:hypothetical protein
MQIPKWVKSITTMLSGADRRLCLPHVAIGATIASLSAGAVSALGTKAHAEDIQNPTDSGFTQKNQKYILTAADSFVITKRDTLRFGREAVAPTQGAPIPTYVPRPPQGGHSSHYSHSSHSSHASHSSHRSGGV